MYFTVITYFNSDQPHFTGSKATCALWLPYQSAGPKKHRLSSTKVGNTAILFTSVHLVPAQCLAYIFMREREREEKEEGKKNASYLRSTGIYIGGEGEYLLVIGP